MRPRPTSWSRPDVFRATDGRHLPFAAPRTRRADGVALAVALLEHAEDVLASAVALSNAAP